ncbi:MAG: RHS repeat-associated core domain-containing protein [Desulfovibrio sp.]
MCQTYQAKPNSCNVSPPLTELSYRCGRGWRGVKEVLYDSFGRILNDTNPAMCVPLGFGFGLHDRDTGWVRMGWRDYDPETGRFTALDPIGYAGGDSDLYGYCVDDPVNLVDNWGLSAAAVYPGAPLLSPAAHPVFQPGTLENDVFVKGALDALRGAKEGAGKAAGQLVDWAQDAWEDINPKAKGKFEAYEPVDYDPSHHNNQYDPNGEAIPVLRFPDAEELDPNIYYKPHRKNKRKSNRKTHEQGEARRDKDAGGEKGDARRIRYRLNK